MSNRTGMRRSFQYLVQYGNSVKRITKLSGDSVKRARTRITVASIELSILPLPVAIAVTLRLSRCSFRYPYVLDQCYSSNTVAPVRPLVLVARTRTAYVDGSKVDKVT